MTKFKATKCRKVPFHKDTTELSEWDLNRDCVNCLMHTHATYYNIIKQ